MSNIRTRICYSCGGERFKDYELEKKLGTSIPVCPRCYITAILELDRENFKTKRQLNLSHR